MREPSTSVSGSASEPRHRVDAGLARLHIVLAAPFRVGRLGIITHVVVEHVDAARRSPARHRRYRIARCGRTSCRPAPARGAGPAPRSRPTPSGPGPAGGFGTGCRRHRRAPGPSPDRPRRTQSVLSLLVSSAWLTLNFTVQSSDSRCEFGEQLRVLEVPAVPVRAQIGASGQAQVAAVTIARHVHHVAASRAADSCRPRSAACPRPGRPRRCRSRPASASWRRREILAVLLRRGDAATHRTRAFSGEDRSSSPR